MVNRYGTYFQREFIFVRHYVRVYFRLHRSVRRRGSWLLVRGGLSRVDFFTGRNLFENRYAPHIAAVVEFNRRIRTRALSFLVCFFMDVVAHVSS